MSTPQTAPDAANRSQQRLTTPTPPGESRVYHALAAFAGAVFRTTTREVWDDAATLPATGGVLVVSNHLSYADPISVGRYLIWSGRWPRFLGKAGLWSVPVVGWLARSTHQIPVLRGTQRASEALEPAHAALAAGECLVIYPEGGRTRDPDQWPMQGHTGAARLALATGVPVVPVTNWGAQDFLPPFRWSLPRVWPRRTLRVRAGERVDLADLAGRADDQEAVREATARIMRAIVHGVEELRGEEAPADVWDPRVGRRVPRT